MKDLKLIAALLIVAIIAVTAVHAQNSPQAGTNPVQSTQSLYFTTPISATAAVNNQVTLTIAAPAAGLYNYICSLDIGVSQNGTATANTNGAWTSTNLNSWAWKSSTPATANVDWTKSFLWGTPATGCAKSTASATATTIVSPSALAQAAFVASATFYQAP